MVSGTLNLILCAHRTNKTAPEKHSCLLPGPLRTSVFPYGDIGAIYIACCNSVVSGLNITVHHDSKPFLRIINSSCVHHPHRTSFRVIHMTAHKQNQPHNSGVGHDYAVPRPGISNLGRWFFLSVPTKVIKAAVTLTWVTAAKATHARQYGFVTLSIDTSDSHHHPICDTQITMTRGTPGKTNNANCD